MKIPVILIVEDEFIIATDIRMSLEAMGYKVCAIVSSGEEAIARTEKEKPDLVLMDVVLKGKLDGVEAAEQIRFLFNIPIIYLTAYTDGNTVERAKRTEPSGYIIKPFNDRELNTAIEIALYKHMAETKLRESEERFRTLFNQANDSIFVYDTKGNFHSVNPKAYRNLGYTEDELLQMRVSDVDLDFAPIEDETLFWDRLPISIERRCKRKDGSIFPADVRLSIIVSHEQRFVLAFVNDITKRKEAEREREELIQKLREALEKVKTLSGLVPICAKCKKIRDDKGYWNLLESYIEKHSEASFSHSLCPECSDELYGNEDWYQKMKKIKKMRIIDSMPVSE